jgi:hypothetical protein
MSNIKLFQNKKIRSVWDEEEQQWYFSVVDVVGALTDSVNPTDYLKKMRKRDEALATYLGTNCPQVEMMTETGKKRRTLAANVQALFRIIQSIPSPKAEPFKLWLAQVGYERVQEIENPELAQERMKELFMEGFRLNDLKRWHEGFERKEQTSTISPGNTLKLEKDDPRFVWPIPQHELDAPGVDLAPNESNK